MTDAALGGPQVPLVDAVLAYGRDTSSLSARAQLAAQLERIGSPHAPEAWCRCVDAAAARGAFFTALTLVRRRLRVADRSAALAGLAARFGIDRPRTGAAPAPPVPTPRDIELPDGHEALVTLAAAIACEPVHAEPARMPDVPVFGRLVPAEFVALAEYIEEVPLEPHQSLVRQGSTDRSLWFLAVGRARVVQDRGDPVPVHIADVRAPAVIGEIGLLREAPRRASVIANDVGLAYRIEAAALRRLGEAWPELAAELRRFAKRRLISNLVRRCRPLEGLTVDGPLLAAFRFVDVPEAGRVFDEGAAAPGLFAVLHGAAEVWARADDGERVRVATLQEGDLFGEMSLVDAGPTRAAVTMPEGGLLLHLPPQRYREIRGRLPKLEPALSALSDVRRGELLAVLHAAEGEFVAIEDVWLLDA